MYIDAEVIIDLRRYAASDSVAIMIGNPFVFALVPDASRRHVLMARNESGQLVLPSAQCEQDTELTGTIARAVSTRWGITAPFLRSPAKLKGPDAATLWLCAFDAEHAAPPGLEWADIDSAANVDLPADLTAAIRTWQDEQRSGAIPPRRAAWARSGWYESMRAWIVQQLTHRDITVIGDPEVVQQWGISAVYRQATNRGDHYFKAVFGGPSRGFWHEPRVTRALSAACGRGVTPVVAIDPDRGWMLMPDMELTAQLAEADARSQNDGVVALAHIQRDRIDRTQELKDLGCPDRSPAALDAKLGSMIAEAVAHAGLTEAECAELEAHGEELHDMCGRAKSGPIPHTVMHGDFHTGNAGVRADGSVCIFDWSDAAIGHPFWDLPIYLETAQARERTRLRDTYLRQWSSHASEPVLRQHFDDASVLAAVNQVITYQGIVAGLEESDRTFSGGVLRWWRRALTALRERQLETPRA